MWTGFPHMLPSQASKCLNAFHEHVNRVASKDGDRPYDQTAARPLACFTHLSKIGIQAVAVNLVHTKLSDDHRGWPRCRQDSGFASIWRPWSTCRVRSLVSATDELHAFNLPGRRQTWATTTIRNDLATVNITHDVYRDRIERIQHTRVKDVSGTFVLQLLLLDWARKGRPNSLGFEGPPARHLSGFNYCKLDIKCR